MESVAIITDSIRKTRLKDPQKSAQKTFSQIRVRFCCTSNRIWQERRDHKCRSDWLEFLNNVRLWPYLEICCYPAEARLMCMVNEISGCYHETIYCIICYRMQIIDPYHPYFFEIFSHCAMRTTVTWLVHILFLYADLSTTVTLDSTRS